MKAGPDILFKFLPFLSKSKILLAVFKKRHFMSYIISPKPLET
jgi:hypothetical protein